MPNWCISCKDAQSHGPVPAIDTDGIIQQICYHCNMINGLVNQITQLSGVLDQMIKQQNDLASHTGNLTAYIKILELRIEALEAQ